MYAYIKLNMTENKSDYNRVIFFYSNLKLNLVIECRKVVVIR